LQEVSLRLPKEYDGRVIFSFGLNDTTVENGKTRVNCADSIKNVCEILNEAQKMYPVLMVGLAPYAEQEDPQRRQRTIDLSKQFALICNELNVPYLEVFSILEKSNIWINEARANDGVHPKAEGYTEFAQIVENWDAWLNWFPHN
jgi:lysophospholipase L1-like esterase